jgi:hypothetical protein
VPKSNVKLPEAPEFEPGVREFISLWVSISKRLTAKTRDDMEEVA